MQLFHAICCLGYSGNIRNQVACARVAGALLTGICNCKYQSIIAIPDIEIDWKEPGWNSSGCWAGFTDPACVRGSQCHLSGNKNQNYHDQQGSYWSLSFKVGRAPRNAFKPEMAWGNPGQFGEKLSFTAF